MSAPLAALYFLCITLLIGSGLFILARNPRSTLHRLFALLALSLLGWVASLLAFTRPLPLPLVLGIGRFNFAAVVLAVTLAYLFIRTLARGPAMRWAGWLWLETSVLAVVTLVTPAVDQAELVTAGQHVTIYGPMFPLYVLHVLGFLGAALTITFRQPWRVQEDTRVQLRLIGAGILATTLVALTTNVVLPYAYGNFRFIHVGTVSTILFLAAVGYAVFAFHLFRIHVLIRAAFIYTGLVAFALELYSLAISFLAHLLPLGDSTQRAYAAMAVALIVNAFTQQPLKDGLERVADRFLGRHAVNRRKGSDAALSWADPSRSSATER